MSNSKKQTKVLFLFASLFPYIKGESFLKNEIFFLSKKFDKIYLITTNYSKSKKIIFNLPNNIIHKPLNLSDSIFTKLKLILLGFMNIGIKDKNSKKNIKNFLVFNYMKGKGSIIANKIKPLIKENIDNKIYLYSYWFASSAYAIAKLKKYKNIYKAISRAHGFDLYEYRQSTNYLPLREFILSNIDNVYTCSKDGANYLKNLYPNFKEKISYSYLGTNDCSINNNTTLPFTIISVSNIIKIKRVNLILDALNILINKNYNIRWICIGDGDELNNIKNTAASLKVDKNINFKGYLTNDKVYNILKEESLHLFINVSETEGLPVSLMEALSFSIPIIATDIGGSREIANEEVGSLLPKDIDGSTLALEIEKFINLDKANFNQLKINARTKWLELFNSDNNFTKFAEDLSN